MISVPGRVAAGRGARFRRAWGLAPGGAAWGGLALVGARASLVSVVGPMLAVGVGASLATPAMTHAAIDHTPKERAGIGSAVLNARPQGGRVGGSALLGGPIRGGLPRRPRPGLPAPGRPCLP